MSDLIITPGSGKIDFIYQSGQEVSRLESIIIDPIDGLVFSGKISASSVTSPINVTATSSNLSYPFIFASSTSTGPKSLLIDSAGGTYNPSTNTATIDVTGTATTASYANALNAANNYTVGTITGALTGTATTASYANALNAANKYTVVGITGSLFGTSSWATNATAATTVTTNANLTGEVTSIGNATTISSSAITTAKIADAAVTNAKLASSSVTIGSTAVSLGASPTVTIAGLNSVTSTTFVGALTGTATTASYANNLNAANSYTVAGITGNLTGTATTASYANALNATNQYTVGGITGSLFGTSSWATNATNALQLGGTAAASYVTLTGAQNLSDKTITGTFTGNLTGTATTASYANALNAANSYTIAGLTVNGNFAVNGSLTVFSASNVYITSSNLVVTDNIITMNALSPYQRYAGIQMYDSGSGTLSNFLWDGDGDYFFLSGSSVNGKIITGPDSQANLSSNFVPKATAGYKLGNSLIYDNGTNVGIGTTTVNQKLSIYPGTTGGISLQDSSGETRSHFFIDNTNPIYSTGIRTFNYYLDFDSSGGSQNAIRFYTGTGGIGTGTERIRITSTGNIGIGTNTPGALLEISSSTVASLLNIKGTGGNGILFVSGSGNVGIGTTVPAAKLHVNSTTAGATLLRTDGTNGTLFSVVDDLSDSLMSVNNSAGLPVLEVFADDRIVMGQYGQNDFVVVNNKVGIGTNNPANKLTVSGSVSIGESYINTTAPSNGLIVQGNVGIGTTTTFAKLVVSNGSGENIEFTPGNATVNGGLIESINRSTGTTRPDLNLFTSGASNGSIKFYTNGVNERMRVHYDGNVGIGTSSPSYKLEVYSGAKTSAFTGLSISNFNNYDGTAASLVTSQLRFAILENDTGTYNAPARTFAILESGNEANNSSSDGFFAISTRFNGAVAQKFRITAAGNVGIGTTSPTAKLDVSGTSFLRGDLNAGKTANLNTTTAVNGTGGGNREFVTFTGASATGFTGTDNADQGYGYFAATIVSGRSYEVSATMVVTNGTTLDWVTSTVLSSPTVPVQLIQLVPVSNTTYSFVATGDATYFGVGFNRTSGTMTAVVSNFSLKEVGSVLVASNNNVGIGTTNPVAKLQVAGNISGSSFTSSISNAVGFFGTSSWATNATNALQLGGTVAADYVTLTGTQTLTNKTLTSPTLVTPVLGTPSSGDLTSCTFPTLNQSTTGTAATASYANALNPANKYTVVGITGSLFGTSSWASNAVTSLVCTGNSATATIATTASYANNLNAANNYTVGTITGALTGTATTASYANALNAANSYTVTGITGALTGNVTGTATTASYANALNPANNYTVTGITGALTGNVTGTATTASYANALNPANNYTVGTITGALTGTATTASYANNLNAANKYTVVGITGSLFGTSSWATNATTATNALQLGGVVAASYVTLADTQSLTNKTITGTFTGNLTGTATTASYANALNPANSYTVGSLTSTTQVGGTSGTLVSYVTPGIYANGTSTGNAIGIISNTTFANQGAWANIGLHQTGSNVNDINAGVYLSIGGWYQSSGTGLPVYIGGGYTSNSSSILSVVPTNTAGVGNVGIGITRPLSKLHISGSGQTIMRLDSDTTTNVSQFQIKAASDAVIIMGMFGGSATGNNYGVTAAGQAYFGTSTLGSPHPTSLVIGNASNIPIIFSTNNVERMRIDGAGLVGIGTTVPSTLLHAYGSDGRYFTFSGTSGLFTIQRNVITTGGSNPVLSLINTQGMDAAGVVGRGTAIQLDLGYGGSSSAVGTAARGARIAALGETLYDATAANQNAALVFFTSTSGSLTEKLRIRSDGSLSPVSISSTTAGATLLRTDGTNGTLFSVVDDLSDSLMSVNNSAGLPVLEVFADDRIVAGQYGQNDLIVINNKVGIGTNNPVAKLQVTSSTSIPSAIFMGGNVGIGTTNPVGKLDVRAGSGGEIIFGSYDANYTVRVQSGDQLNFYNGASANPGYINYAGGATVLSQNLHVEKATGGTTGLVRIKADGNLGIGTTLPTTPLHVVGVISGSSFSGAGTGLTGTAANLTAGTATTAASVTNGVYTTGAQSIAGNKTFTGTTIVTGSIETAAVRETFSAVSSTSTVSIDLSTATVFNLTFTSTISAFNITNVNTNRVNSFTLITAPNGTGATIAWSFQTNGGGAANVKWASNVSPTATTTTGRFDIFSFVYNGTNWYGFTGGQNYV